MRGWIPRGLYVMFIVEIAPSLSMALYTHYIQSILRDPPPTPTAVQVPLERSLPDSTDKFGQTPAESLIRRSNTRFFTCSL
jgi:hypothetical protein